MTSHIDLEIDPATGDSLEIGDLNGNGVTGSQGAHPASLSGALG